MLALKRVGPADDAAVNNFRLDDFLTVNRKLAEVREFMNARRDENIAALDLQDVEKVFNWIGTELFKLRLDARREIRTVLGLIKKAEGHCSIVTHYLDEAIRSIDYQVKTEWTHHYGARTSNISEGPERWFDVLRAFPSTHFEVQSALDCFALEHYTASVFHFMRLSEYGLRALAVELSVSLPKDKPLTHANWGDIIGHCEKRVKEIGLTVPAGDAKDEALAFYSTALAQLHSLKNKYRNNVMHARKTFNNPDAADASRFAKTLMETLATKLSERKRKKGFTADGKIDWGFPTRP